MKVKKLALIVLLAGLVLAVSGCGKGKVIRQEAGQEYMQRIIDEYFRKD